MIPLKGNLISVLSSAANIGNVSSARFINSFHLCCNVRVDGANRDSRSDCIVKCLVGLQLNIFFPPKSSDLS